MKRKAIFVSILFLALLFKPSLGQEKETLSLSLEDCILKALKENLKVAVESYNPELADAYLSKAKELFMPRFEISYGSERTENPSSWWLEQAPTVISKSADYSASIIQQIPTGGNFSLSLTGYRAETNQGFQTINPVYRNSLRLDFTQPLLRDFGFKVSKREIIIARNNLDMSLDQLQSVLINTIYLVQEAYWNLVYSIENYKVKTQSLQLAQDLLTKSRKEVEFGKLAPIEILNAEAEVASREADILQAEVQIKRSEDLVRNLINLGEEESQKRIVPLDKPEFVKKEVSMEEALKLAMERRPELKMKRKDIESKELNLSVAKNQLLPGLSLNFSYWSPGISGDRIKYLDDNPFLGVIVGKEIGSPWDSFRDSFKLLYDNWNVGLTLSIPLSNFLTKADYVRAKMETEKSLLELKDSEKQIFLDIKNAVREVESNAKRVEAYRVARELAEKRLEAEEKKLNVGLTTNYFVLQYQEELANAKSMELKSLVDYNLAWATLERATATSLEKHNIKTS